MYCEICGKEIPSVFDVTDESEATYKLMENGDKVCMDQECRLAHIQQHATQEQLDQYFEECAEQGITGLADLAKNGLDALPPWEIDELIEWYESGNVFELTNETYTTTAYFIA